MKRLTFKFTYAIAILIAFFLLFFSVSLGNGTTIAKASAGEYSNVLDDLQKAGNFNASDYPGIYNDYSLQVIQLAESKDGDVLLYVYQPCALAKELTATTARISTDRATWKDYKLELLSRESVFQKYKVNGLKVGSSSVRYYDIAAIHRAWVRGIDASAGGDNTIDEIAYQVAQLWTVFTVNGTVYYEMTKTDVITITNKYLGYIRYSNGFKLYKDSCDSHYLAFSTDFQIDNLMQADVSYIVKSVKDYYTFGALQNRTFGDPEPVELTLDYNDIGGNRADGWWADKVEYHRIESAKEFADSEDFDQETKTKLKQYKWVLRFTETDYMAADNGLIKTEHYSQVSEVTILRLKFETAGVTYNLGVVDNKQTGSLKPTLEIAAAVPLWVWVIVVVVAVIVVIIVYNILKLFFPIIGDVVKAVWTGFKFVLWWTVCLPFRGIAALVKYGRKRKAQAATSTKKNKAKK